MWHLKNLCLNAIFSLIQSFDKTSFILLLNPKKKTQALLILMNPFEVQPSKHLTFVETSGVRQKKTIRDEFISKRCLITSHVLKNLISPSSLKVSFLLQVEVESKQTPYLCGNKLSFS